MNPLRFIPGANTDMETIERQITANVMRDIPWLCRGELKSGPLSIVGGGPSLSRHWHQLMAGGTDIMALNNAYAYLTERDIVPDYFMLLDARPENVEFLRDARPQTVHYIAAQAHPDVFERLACLDTRLYLTNHPFIIENAHEWRAPNNGPKVIIHGTVGTVGIKALALGYALGYREFHLYGYDSSYEGDAHHAFTQTLNDSATKMEVFLGSTRYVTSASMAHQAAEFPAFAQDLVANHGCQITLKCDGLLPDFVRAGNARGEIPLEKRERDKYERMWQVDQYRKAAPGEHHVRAAIDALGIEKGATVIDFGCGTGRGAAKMQALGMNVTGVDFAANCLDAGVSIPFVKACLWDMPEMMADFGYCTDVMEHIPSNCVSDVLAGIAARCRYGAYFNIDTEADNLGGIIGHKLHLTVASADAWAEMLRQYWPEVEVREGEGSAVFVARSRAQQPMAVGEQ